MGLLDEIRAKKVGETRIVVDGVEYIVAIISHTMDPAPRYFIGFLDETTLFLSEEVDLNRTQPMVLHEVRHKKLEAAGYGVLSCVIASAMELECVRMNDITAHAEFRDTCFTDLILFKSTRGTSEADLESFVRSRDFWRRLHNP